MSHWRIDLDVPVAVSGYADSFRVRATVHVPKGVSTPEPRSILFCMPGGGYSRRYFDLAEDGYSEAEHHVRHGVVVIAIDHLGAGDSDIPDLSVATLELVAEANHVALLDLIKRLGSGELSEGVAPIVPKIVIGSGQSMGGHIGVLMQAKYRCFDGLAVLGSSLVCTRLPAPVSGQEICSLGGKNLAQTLDEFSTFDWDYAFHWDDVPEVFRGSERVARQGKGPMPYWMSATAPDARPAMLPGAFSAHAAMISVPVLLARGERDVCQDPLRELAAFMACPDLAHCTIQRMAHMHNFAVSRELLWRRLSSFIDQVANK